MGMSLICRGVVMDMDGTFFIGESLLPGALELLRLLNERDIPFSFLTNNTSRGRQDYVQKLTRLGVAPQDARIYTAGDATISYLKATYPGKKVFLMGTRSLAESFLESGIPLAQDESEAEICVLGYDTELTYARLCHFTNLLNRGLPYIATHPDINCPAKGYYLPDIGAMMAMIKASTGRDADVVVGKPNRLILDRLADRWNLPTADLLMVGDRLYTDVATGVNHGMTGILVLSGEAKRSDVGTSDVKPDLIFGRLSDIIPYL